MPGFRPEFMSKEFERLTKTGLKDLAAVELLISAYGAESVASWFIWLGQQNQALLDPQETLSDGSLLDGQKENPRDETLPD